MLRTLQYNTLTLTQSVSRKLQKKIIIFYSNMLLFYACACVVSACARKHTPLRPAACGARPARPSRAASPSPARSSRTGTLASGTRACGPWDATPRHGSDIARISGCARTTFAPLASPLHPFPPRNRARCVAAAAAAAVDSPFPV